MKPSKKPAAAGGRQIREPLQRVPFAAQIFGNYVLVPPRRHPDGTTRPVGLHGAAVLVFSDQPAEKVKLRTGYASLVSRHVALDAGEDRSDQIVSGHKNSSQLSVRGSQRKKNATPTDFHCSACGALVQPGGQFCPGCG